MLRLARRCLLYSQDHQQLLELNETADRIWRALSVFGSVSRAAQDVAAIGLPREQAVELVRHNLAESLSHAACVRLEYSDLGPAVQAIEEVAGVQAQAA